MAFNGSGTFNLVAGNPVVSGTTISSTTHNNTNSDIATGLTNCVTRDGQSPPTSNLPMGGYKITGLAAASANGDAARYEQLSGSASIVFSAAAAAAAANVPRADQFKMGMPSISASIATGFLTLGAQPHIAEFRNSDVADGAPNLQFITSALSLATDAVTASFGLTTAVKGTLLLLEIYTGAAVVLGVVNQAGGLELGENAVLTSTTAITGAANSASVVYTTAALGAGLYPCKVIGSIDIVWTSGSGFVTAPAAVSGVGQRSVGGIPKNSYIQLDTILAAHPYGTTNTAIPNFTNVTRSSGSDITYAQTDASGANFTINTAGLYGIKYSDSGAAPLFIGLSLNSTQLTTAVNNITVATRLALGTTTLTYSDEVSAVLYLKVGDVIRPHHEAGRGIGSYPATFIITKIL